MQTYFIENDLPECLSKEEEKRLLIQIRNGDMEARDTFIVANIRLVLSEVHGRFKCNYKIMQELVAEGIIGLIKAVDSFDVSKNYSFSTYACRCIHNEILMFIRKNNKTNLDVSLQEPLFLTESGVETVLQDTLYADINVEEECIQSQMIDRMMEVFECLPAREKQILSLYFGIEKIGDCYSQQEIADLLHISRSYVSRLISDTLAMLKKELMEPIVFQKTKK